MNILKMFFSQNRKLRTEILVTFSSLLLIFVSCEIFYSTDANKKIVLQFEKDFYSDKISSMTANWLDSYFSQIELIVSVLSKNKLFEQDVLINGFADFEELFKVALRKTEFALSFQLTLNDGSMLQVRNIRGFTSFQGNLSHSLPEYATYAVRKMELIPGEENISESWEYLNNDFTPIIKENLPVAQYDPREGGWYINTVVNKKTLWSEPYKFKTSEKFGVTVSAPILTEEKKRVHGVISIDFSLNDFADLLHNVKTTANSCIRLINDKNEIIASTLDNEKIEPKKETKSGADQLLKVAEINDESLQIATKNLIGGNETHVTYETSDGKAFIASKRRLHSVPFSILTITPQSDFTDEFDRFQINMFLLSLFVFLLVGLAVHLFSHRISAPILRLCKSAISVRKMDLENYLKPLQSNILEVKELSSAIERMNTSISAFSKYVPKEIVHGMVKSNVKACIGGITKEVTMFFSDIEKFSTVSEKLPAEYLIFHLSEYFDELTKIIAKHNGIIDKYIGDSIMAVWGALSLDDNQVINACEAALDCQQMLQTLKDKWISLGKPPLPTRIGLHSGSAIVGNIGSQDRMNFTAIGNTVDIASSLEGANKVYGTWILASETVERKARDKILFRIIDKVAVNGSHDGVTIFEPLCSLQNANDMYYEMLELCSKSKEAFELYQNQNFKDALKLYSEMSKTFPEKAASINVLIKHCEEFLENPPKSWDGINRLW